MADQVKEELIEQTDAQMEGNEVEKEESADDYFNPFAEEKEEVVEKKEEVEEKKEEKEEVKPVVDDSTAREVAELKADREASKEVNKLVKENPMFAEYSDQIAEITAKAILQGHKNPVEFAIRNLKSPMEWIEIGKASGERSATNVIRTKVGGASISKSDQGSPDFGRMDSDTFNKYVSNVKNN